MSYIVIIGRPEDACCSLVEERLSALGRETIFLRENQLFPGLGLVWRLADGTPDGMIRQAQQTAALADIDGVLARFSGFPVTAEEFQTPDGQYLCSEWHAFMRGYVRGLSCPVVNRVPPGLWYKPSLSIPDLIALVPGLRFKLPKTLVTTSFEDARTFFRDCGGRICYSPLTVSSNYFIDTDEGLQKLEKVSELLPLSLSEMVPGEPVDVYVVGKRLISDSYGTGVGLEPAVQDHCLEMAASLGLTFCRFALVNSSRKEWYCRGLSCMPDLIHCAEEIRTTVVDNLAEVLTGAKRATA